MYSKWQEDDDKIITIYLEIEFSKGYSDDNYDSFEHSDKNLLILDDQMSEASKTNSLANRFTKG